MYNYITSLFTNKSIDIQSQKGKKILAKYVLRMKGGAKCKGDGDCANDKICNTRTGRCVKKKGKSGKEELERRKVVALEQKEEKVPVAPIPAEEKVPVAPIPAEEKVPVAPIPAEEKVPVAPIPAEEKVPVAPPAKAPAKADTGPVKKGESKTKAIKLPKNLEPKLVKACQGISNSGGGLNKGPFQDALIALVTQIGMKQYIPDIKKANRNKLQEICAKLGLSTVASGKNKRATLVPRGARKGKLNGQPYFQLANYDEWKLGDVPAKNRFVEVENPGGGDCFFHAAANIIAEASGTVFTYQNARNLIRDYVLSLNDTGLFHYISRIELRHPDGRNTSNFNVMLGNTGRRNTPSGKKIKLCLIKKIIETIIKKAEETGEVIEKERHVDVVSQVLNIDISSVGSSKDTPLWKNKLKYLVEELAKLKTLKLKTDLEKHLGKSVTIKKPGAKESVTSEQYLDRLQNALLGGNADYVEEIRQKLATAVLHHNYWGDSTEIEYFQKYLIERHNIHLLTFNARVPEDPSKSTIFNTGGQLCLPPTIEGDISFGIIFRRGNHWTTLAMDNSLGGAKKGAGECSFVLDERDMGNFNELHKQHCGVKCSYTDVNEYKTDLLGDLSVNDFARRLLEIVIEAKDSKGEFIYGIGPTTKSAFTNWYELLYEHEIMGGDIEGFLRLLENDFEDFNIIINPDGSNTKGVRKDYFRGELEILEV